MTTLYKPVLIKSAEQAEALPIGTVALTPGGHPAMKSAPGVWIVVGVPSYRSDAQAVGSTALVPIEAEEEHGARGDGEAEDFYLTRRFTTPWEEA